MRSQLYLGIYSILILCIGTAVGYDIEYITLNYNTLNPVENANVTLWNITLEDSDLTDSNGHADLSLTTAGTYQTIIIRSGYDIYEADLAVTTDSVNTVYLRPYSNEGIIRLTVVDLTLSNHEHCFYFSSNDRLHECFKLNDTVTLHNNINYTWIPKITKLDLISSPSGFQKYIYFFVPIIIGLGAFGLIIITVVAVVWYMAKKTGRSIK